MARRRRSRKYLKLTNVLSDTEYESVLDQANEYLQSYLRRWQVEPDGRQTELMEWLMELVCLYQKEHQQHPRTDLPEFARFHGAPYDRLLAHVDLSTNEIDSGISLAYYSRPDIQKELARHAEERQILLHYNGPYLWGFRTQNDIVPLAFWILHRTGRWPSFHASVARYDELGQSRHDVIFEIDHETEDWRVCFNLTRPVIRLLRREGIPFRIKFSGNASAHIIIPAEVLPGERNGYHAGLYSFVRAHLKQSESLDMTFQEDPHHLLRLPYALNEFTGLASIPIPEEAFDSFSPAQARPDRVEITPNWWPIPPEVCREGQEALKEVVG